LLNLRKRMAKIRVFDPACGSGNFLVIAYKEMRAIEAEINRRRGEPDRASKSRSPTFAGSSCATSRRRSPALRWSSPSISATCCIAGRSWPGRVPALRNENWITCGNALRWIG
jgi:hypothetical protein